MTLILRPPGRGNHSPLLLTYTERLRGELPSPVEAKVGAQWVVNGLVYRVSKVIA